MVEKHTWLEPLMLHAIADYLVPANLMLLMLIAGTEIDAADFAALQQRPQLVILGAGGQLLLLPLVALGVLAVAPFHPAVAMGTLILSLCPGGGISNYYCYVARSDVLLSATITAAGTLVSLVTIPVWLAILPALLPIDHASNTVPKLVIVGQLLAFMVLPMMLGAVLRHRYPGWINRFRPTMRAVSTALVLFVLLLAIWTVQSDLAAISLDIAVAATLFILAAMLVGAALGAPFGKRDQAVLVIESGVRNIAVAMILGRTLLGTHEFGVLASFITGYFTIEIVIMLTYAHLRAGRAAGGKAYGHGRS